MRRTATPVTKTAAVLAVLALSVSACGGSGDDKKAAKSISDEIVKNKSGTTAFTFSRKQGDCIGKGMVDKVGTDKLVKYKIVTKKLKPDNSVTGTKMSAADAKSTSDVFFDCADVKALVTKAIESAGSLPASVKPCVDKALSESALRSFLTSTFEGKTTDAQKKLTSGITTCAQKAG